MANIITGIFHIIQGFVQTIISLIRGGFLSVYSLIRGVFSFAFGIVEHLAGFVGSSFNFVLSNIVVIGLLALAFVIYRDRQSKVGKPALGQKKLA